MKKGVLEGVTGYHWLVVIIASGGWLFDCMDQRIFILARESALKELLGSDVAAQAALKQYLGYATTSMILGWATGGRHVFVQAERTVPSPIYRVDLDSGERELWTDLAPPDPAGIFKVDRVQLSSDGMFQVYSNRRVLSQLVIMEGLADPGR